MIAHARGMRAIEIGSIFRRNRRAAHFTQATLAAGFSEPTRPGVVQSAACICLKSAS